MNRTVFAIYDRTAGVFNAPFLAHNAAAAERLVDAQKTDPGSLFSTHPDDFVIFEIGTYDQQTGVLIPLTAPKPIHAPLRALEA